MGREASLAEIAASISSEREWVITGHTMPDGDCVGSIIALRKGLKAIGINAYAVLEDPPPPIYQYLNGYDSIIGPKEAASIPWANIIFLDCAEEERIGDGVRALAAARTKSVNIDHHFGNGRYGDLNHVDSGAAATGELIFELLLIMQAPVHADIASALYAALVMDTNNFLNANTTSRSFQVAAELVKLGASISSARLNLFESKDRREMQMIRMALDTMDFSPQGRVAWGEIPYSFLVSIEAVGFNPEGIVNYLLMPRGVEVALLFREIAPGITKISLRSKNNINVSDMAAHFGGGGHPPAAGARVDCELPAARDQVLEYIIGIVEGSPRG